MTPHRILELLLHSLRETNPECVSLKKAAAFSPKAMRVCRHPFVQPAVLEITRALHFGWAPWLRKQEESKSALLLFSKPWGVVGAVSDPSAR